MDETQSLQEFIEYSNRLRGDEKSEAQLFCDRFFRAFGLGGIIEADGELEARVKFSTSGTTKFADCLWSPDGRDGVLIEMKKRSVKNLENHFSQPRDYWIEMNPEEVIGEGAQKPRYIILCNFDRFLIYRDLSLVDEVNVQELVDRSSAFNFMKASPKEPIFKNNVEEISQEAARKIGEIFKYLVFDKQESRESAQRFLLQCVLSLFSEDFGLLPNSLFSELVRDCLDGQSSYDLFGSLFRQMASEKPAKAGRFKDVKYFNGGLFDVVEPIELDEHSLQLLNDAAKQNWKYVNPSIFGALFESTMNADERHKFGAHFTYEKDILKIVNPTIIRPWKEKIRKAKTLQELADLLTDIGEFKVLDPACGCGNFLYVAYRALRDIEMQIIEKIVENYSERSYRSLGTRSTRIKTKQFFGLDVLPVAVEVAKMTMMLAKELAADEWNQRITNQLSLEIDEGLPLERLDDNIIEEDALFYEWPEADVVIGNPPYQSKNNMLEELGFEYISKLRKAYPEISGRADYCVYWLRLTHDYLTNGQRAGLVGTNTIRQNYSRESGLDYIVENGGTITDAVSTQVWSGDAQVHVSIVNWIKGSYSKKKYLEIQRGDSVNDKFEHYSLGYINSALSVQIDLKEAKDLNINKNSKTCYQGQTHGHKGFLLNNKDEIEKFDLDDSFVKPYIIGDNLLNYNGKSIPFRYVVDGNSINDIFSLKRYSILYDYLFKNVYPDIKNKADNERKKSQKDVGPRQNHFKKWWKFWRARDEMISEISKIKRYIACSRVTKRPIFEFVSPVLHPNDALEVFPLADDYSFGILQSEIHWEWFTNRCSTLTERFRYTSNTVFDSFPWPQNPTKNQILKIANYAADLRAERRRVMKENDLTLRELYRLIEDTPSNPVSDIQDKLDMAVRDAYGMKKSEDILSFLLNLNLKLAEKEGNGETIVGPGIPPTFSDVDKIVTDDCIKIKK